MKKSPWHQDFGDRGRVSQDLVDSMAVDMLTFLSNHPERLVRFFEVTGLTVAGLREVAGTPAFNADLISHLCSDEAMLRAFAESSGRQPDDVEAIRARLA